MTDIRIVSANSLVETLADFLLLPEGDLDETHELENYAVVALMSDRTADASEVLPDPDDDDRRGWWADYQAADIWNGWAIGTRNWLLERAKIITDVSSVEGVTQVRAELYTREALQPLIDQGIASYVDVASERVQDNRIYVTTTIYRGPKKAIQLRFEALWDNFASE